MNARVVIAASLFVAVSVPFYLSLRALGVYEEARLLGGEVGAALLSVASGWLSVTVAWKLSA